MNTQTLNRDRRQQSDWILESLRSPDALLAELPGEPMAEIAIRMGSNRNAIYKLTHDARKRLKRGLERAGHSAATVAVAFS